MPKVIVTRWPLFAITIIVGVGIYMCFFSKYAKKTPHNSAIDWEKFHRKAQKAHEERENREKREVIRAIYTRLRTNTPNMLHKEACEKAIHIYNERHTI